MSEPFIAELKPAEFRQIRSSLRKKGVSLKGVTEFLSGKPVRNSADRLKLVAIFIAQEKTSPISRR